MVADAPSGHDPQGVETFIVFVQVAKGQGGLTLPEEHLCPLGLFQQHIWKEMKTGSRHRPRACTWTRVHAHAGADGPPGSREPETRLHKEPTGESKRGIDGKAGAATSAKVRADKEREARRVSFPRANWVMSENSAQPSDG